MDLKIVSGVLVTRRHTEGRAVIDFASNAIVDGDLAPGDLQKTKRIAPEGMKSSYFDEVPCITIGLREIEIQTIDRDDHLAAPLGLNSTAFRSIRALIRLDSQLIGKLPRDQRLKKFLIWPLDLFLRRLMGRPDNVKLHILASYLKKDAYGVCLGGRP